ncbi:MAG: hypothetical protein ABH886_01750 [Candidatus Desantisbacteria bacterium]
MAMSLVNNREEEEHILSILPVLLKKNRQFRGELYGILTETFATKDDLRQILEEMRLSREETNKRFDAMQQDMDKRFEVMQQDMDKRFEAVDKRFDAVDKRFDAMDKQFEDQKDWVGTVVGGFQRRAGRSLEDAVAGTLRVALKRKDIKPESLKLREKILDDEGLIGPKGRSYEIDLYGYNGESIIFEVKSYAEEEDVLRFNDKAELARQKFGLVNPTKVFVTLDKSRDMVRTCEEVGIEVV